MDLVDMSRAADRDLKSSILARVHEVQKRNSNLQERTSRATADLSQTSLIYHSQWTYSAVHFLTSIHSCQTISAIARRLWLPEPVVEESLRNLVAWGHVREVGKNFEFAGGTSHISKSSPVLPIFHGNWRTKAVQDCQNVSSNGLHFTNLQTVSRADFERLKQMAAQFVQATTAVATPSTPEDLVVIVCDIFTP